MDLWDGVVLLKACPSERRAEGDVAAAAAVISSRSYFLIGRCCFFPFLSLFLSMHLFFFF